MKSSPWLYLVPLICVFLQGAHTVVSKVSASVISWESISFYRWVVAMVVLVPLFAPGFVREWSSVRPYLGRIALLAFLGMVVYQVAAYLAAQTSSATNMALLGALAPLLSIGWASWLLGYRAGPRVIAGCVVSLLGVVVLVQKGHVLGVFSQVPDIGDIYVLIGVACYALYGVLIQKWKLPIAAAPFFFAQTLFAFAITSAGPVLGDATPLDESNIVVVVLAGLIGSVAVPFLWMKSIQTVGPVTTSLFFNLMPLFTALIAVLVIDERLAPYHGIGALLIIGGVVLAQTAPQRAGK